MFEVLSVVRSHVLVQQPLLFLIRITHRPGSLRPLDNMVLNGAQAYHMPLQGMWWYTPFTSIFLTPLAIKLRGKVGLE